MGTVFRDATLVQIHPPSVERGDLRQQNGRITAIGAGVAAKDGDETVACDGAILIPGFVNGHTHLYSALAPGMPPPRRPPTNFHEVLEFIWWPLDRAHSLESVRASGVVGALAAIRCGVTTLIDHHASPNAIAGSLFALEEGITAVGCRGVLCYEVTDRNRRDEAAEGLAENSAFISASQERSDRLFAGMVGAHASFTLSDKSLNACVALAQKLGVGVHIHAAEDPVDERLTLDAHGIGLLDRFDACGLLDTPGSIIAHGTHFSDEEIERINDHAKTVTIAHNPRSNMNNGVGYARPARMANAPMIGTDGIGADMFAEAQIATFKSNDAHAPCEPARTLDMLNASARFASGALGVPLGVLEVGAAADLVVLDYHPASSMNGNSLPSHFLYCMGPEYVRDVMVDGSWILRNRRFVTIDEPAARATSLPVARALFNRIASA